MGNRRMGRRRLDSLLEVNYSSTDENGNIYEIFSAGCPFNFDEFKEKKGSTTQTILNHIDVVMHHKDENIVNLFVRRSFAEHLWSWIEDCASRL